MMLSRSLPLVLLAALSAAGCSDGAKQKQVREGAVIFENVCGACHTTPVAPPLDTVVGRKVASIPGYAYSDAMKQDGGTWTPQRLKSFLMGPMQMYPEGRMVITPLKPEEADAVIAFLEDASK